MICIARQVGTLIFLLAWLVPWRPAFRTRAKQSKLSFFVNWRDLGSSSSILSGACIAMAATHSART